MPAAGHCCGLRSSDGCRTGQAPGSVACRDAGRPCPCSGCCPGPFAGRPCRPSLSRATILRASSNGQAFDCSARARRLAASGTVAALDICSPIGPLSHLERISTDGNHNVGGNVGWAKSRAVSAPYHLLWQATLPTLRRPGRQNGLIGKYRSHSSVKRPVSQMRNSAQLMARRKVSLPRLTATPMPSPK